MAEYYDTPGTASGLPKYYGNWDANFWVVAPTPNSTFEITLAYIKQPTSLTDSSVSSSGTYISNKYQDLLVIWLSGRSIWILERPGRYVTILRGIFQKSFTIVRDRTTRSKTQR